jgi:signal transduction histidine kinase
MNATNLGLPPLSRRARSICLLAGWASALLGALVVASWAFSYNAVPFMRSVPAFVASGYFLTGLSFFSFAFERVRMTRFLGGATLAAGVVSFALGVLSFMPVTVSMPFSVLVASDNPSVVGFVRLTSGISFMLVGVWFVQFSSMKSTSSRVTLGLTLGSLLFGIGFFAITQQYLWVPVLGGGWYISTALVAIGQVTLGALLMSISYRDHIRLFTRSLWSWLLMPLGIMLLMGTLLMSYFLQRQQGNRIASDMHGAGNQLEAILNVFLTDRITFMQRFAHDLENHFDAFSSGRLDEDDIRMFVGSHPDLVRVRWIYLDGKNIWTLVPAPINVQFDKDQDGAMVFLSKQPNLGANSTGVSILQGSREFSLVTPIQRHGRAVSVLIFDFDSATFIHALPAAALPEGYSIRIQDNHNNLLYSTPGQNTQNAPLSGSSNYQMNLQGLQFNLEMAPLPTNFSHQLFFLPWLVLIAGSTISLLLIWAYWLAQTTQIAKKESEMTNVALEAENSRRSVIEKELRVAQDELEIKIAERTEQLTRSNQELEQFTFIASHDLQEPVRKVANYLDLLVIHTAGKLTPEAQRDVDRILKSVVHMKQLLSELMGLLRVRHDNAPFESVNLSDEVHAVLSGLDNIEGMHVKVDPLPVVIGNRLRLRQLFHNLISNAVKFRGKELPTVLISAYRENDAWIISVRDNGIGIEPEHKNRVFEIFQRLNPRGYPGSGMGLAICKRIVESHGGKIWVESAHGYGSTFKFTLPIHKEVAIQNHDEINVG